MDIHDPSTITWLDVIAEGGESFEQVLHLRELGIRAAQGFVFAPPPQCSAFLQLVETIDPLKGAGESAADQPAGMRPWQGMTRPERKVTGRSCR